MEGNKGDHQFIYGGIRLKPLRNHVNELFKDIPESAQKNALMQEVLQNLEEKVFDLMEQGKTEEDAINKAIVEFGDIDDLRKELELIQPLKKKIKI